MSAAVQPPPSALSATKRSTNNNTINNNEPVDAQVAVIRHDQPLPSLCEVVSTELRQGRHPERPILSRIALVGELGARSSHGGEENLRAVLESVNSIVTKRVNAEDPTGGVVRTAAAIAQQQHQQQQQQGEGGDNTTANNNNNNAAVHTAVVNITGVCVELPLHFICMMESEPQHLLELVKEIDRRTKPVSERTDNTTTTSHHHSSSIMAHHGGSSLGGGTIAAPITGNNIMTSNSNNNSAAVAAPSATTKIPLMRQVQVIYYVDDIKSRCSNVWTHIDATSSANNNNNKDQEGGAITTDNKDGTENNKEETSATTTTTTKDNNNNTEALPSTSSSLPLDTVVVRTVRRLVALAAHAQTLPRARREQFATSTAVHTHAGHIPPVAVVQRLLECELCLTTEEFLEVFAKAPEVVRDRDVCYPAEPPMAY